MIHRSVVLFAWALLCLWSTTSMAASECILDQSVMAMNCHRFLRAEGVEKHCQDMNIKDPLALGEECASRIRKNGGRINCNDDDSMRLMSRLVGEHCKIGDTVVLLNPSRPIYSYLPRGEKWETTPYSQQFLTQFCPRQSIKRLDVGDYTCVIDRGL